MVRKAQTKNRSARKHFNSTNKQDLVRAINNGQLYDGQYFKTGVNHYLLEFRVLLDGVNGKEWKVMMRGFQGQKLTKGNLKAVEESLKGDLVSYAGDYHKIEFRKALKLSFQDFTKVKMGQLKLKDKLIDKINGDNMEKVVDDRRCVPRYIAQSLCDVGISISQLQM